MYTPMDACACHGGSSHVEVQFARKPRAVIYCRLHDEDHVNKVSNHSKIISLPFELVEALPKLSRNVCLMPKSLMSLMRIQPWTTTTLSNVDHKVTRKCWKDEKDGNHSSL